ncbi:hypothetical protein B0H19DRAFT_1190972 [Mycena capillaripes]|nr:hypothetical protein B0H19DRAFT_1190972 [Mycena capillaripes]
MASFALGPLSSRPSQSPSHGTLVNKNAASRWQAQAFPPELLAEIFIHCLPADDELLPISPTPNTPPLVLCAVCLQWRDIALATPGLWGSLMIEANSAYSETGADYVEFCRRWLSRAGSTPVFLNLEAFADGHRIRSLLNMIGGLSQQWRNIDLLLEENFLRSLSLPADGEFPWLEKLSIMPPLSELPMSFCNAPRLREVFIYEFTSQIRLPWHQLTGFRTYNIGISRCLEILRDAPNLIHGIFEIQDYNSPPLPHTVLSHATLQSLRLGRARDVGADELPITVLNCLKAPALKSLTLMFGDALGQVSDMSPFLSFVSRSSFQLHTLALSLMPATTDTLIECLKATSSVVHFKFQPPHLGFDFNSLLCRFTGHSDFLPNLQSFLMVFPFSGVSSVTPATCLLMIDMLRWRWSAIGSTRLQSFQLKHPYNTQFENSIKTLPDFRELQQEGMALDISGRHQWNSDSLIFMKPSDRRWA